MELEVIKRSLEKSISLSEITDAVLYAVLPDGTPHDFETEFWDYKQEAPDSSSITDKSEFNFKIHSIIKDIVSFYNSFGGYLIFGVKDKGTNRIIGCSGAQIDCDDLTKRIQGSTGKTIQCYYKRLTVDSSTGIKEVGLLHIPRRKKVKRLLSLEKMVPSTKEKNPIQKVIFIFVKLLSVFLLVILNKTGGSCYPTGKLITQFLKDLLYKKTYLHGIRI